MTSSPTRTRSLTVCIPTTGVTPIVINPPVDTDSFQRLPTTDVEDFYLMAGELVRYKRPELAVEACNRTRRKLVVIGGGEMLAELRALAGPTVTILGAQPFQKLRHLYSRCRGLIFPGEEDFGMVPVEAMASGRPVIAFGRGGATETVIEGITGTFFHQQSTDSLIETLDRFESMSLDPDRGRCAGERLRHPDSSKTGFELSLRSGCSNTGAS